MIYVPDTSYKCYVVQNADSIRAYEEIPRQNSTINYRDYYINSNYIFKDGVQTFTQNANNIPICLDQSIITKDLYYRSDFDSILIIFTIMSIWCILIPLKLFMRLFRRFN